MSNKFFFDDNETLLERAQNTISNDFFGKFLTVHCKIAEEKQKKYFDMSSKHRIVKAVEKSNRVWTTEEFEGLLDAIDQLKEAGLTQCCDQSPCEIKK